MEEPLRPDDCGQFMKVKLRSGNRAFIRKASVVGFAVDDRCPIEGVQIEIQTAGCNYILEPRYDAGSIFECLNGKENE